MHQHIRPRQQRLESGPVGGLFQIQMGTGLAQRHIRHHPRFRPAWRVDAQHLGPVSGQRSRRHRPRQHPRQVKHPQPRQRSRPGAAKIAQGTRALRPVHQRLRRHRRPLRMHQPGRAVAHRRRCPARAHDRRLQRVDLPAAQRFGNRRALCRAAKYRQRRIPVMWRVGMQPDPAIRRRIVPGNRIPGAGRLPPLRMDRPGIPQRGQPPVHRHRRTRPKTRGLDHLAQRRAHRAKAAGSQIGHREPGRPRAHALNIKRLRPECGG